MKLLMIICPEERQAEIRDLIGRHDVHAYTELTNVIGEGATGKHLGTHAWPGKSVLVFTAVPKAKEQELVAALSDFKTRLYPGEGIRAFALPVESLI